MMVCGAAVCLLSLLYLHNMHKSDALHACVFTLICDSLILCTGEVEEGELAICESAEQRAAAVEAAREAAAAAVEKAARATGKHI
jgi:hypothetical protein